MGYSCAYLMVSWFCHPRAIEFAIAQQQMELVQSGSKL